jgi:hypothetical protein
MIIQIDHLALTSNNFERDSAFLARLGYHMEFTEIEISNPTNKKPLLSKYHPTHDLRLLKKDGSYPIELLNHTSSTRYSGYLTPVASNLPPEAAAEPQAAFFQIEHSQSTGTAVNKVLTQSSKPEASLAFWQQLGFQKKQGADSLLFSSPFQKGALHLEVQSSNAAEQPFRLDDTGFQCLALVSTDADKERKRLQQQGIQVTEPEALVVHKRKLLLFFAQGPAGELVEILSPARS